MGCTGSDVAHSCVQEMKIVKYIDQIELVPAVISICNFNIFFIPFYFMGQHLKRRNPSKWFRYFCHRNKVYFQKLLEINLGLAVFTWLIVSTMLRISSSGTTHNAHVFSKGQQKQDISAEEDAAFQHKYLSLPRDGINVLLVFAIA
jgi:hypothetical protein